MKSVKAIICAVLCLVMVLTSCPAVYAVSEEKEQNLVVFVEGINAKDIVDAKTGETLFPPSAKAIAKAVGTALPGVAEAVVKKDIPAMKEPLNKALNGLFLPVACDGNGVPSPRTKIDYKMPTDEEILTVAASHSPQSRIKYCFDWRLSMQEIAKGLHEFIERVIEVTGRSTVAVVGFSMGSAAVLSYIRLYGYSRLDSVVLLAGAYLGTSSCGEPFSGQLKLDDDALVRYMDGVIRPEESIINVFLSSLIHSLYVSGILDKAVGVASEATDILADAVYSEFFSVTLATMPGLWSLVPAEDYEAAKRLVEPKLTPEFTKIIDWYHDEVQRCAEELIQGCLDRGVKLGIIAKYGYAITPCISDINTMSDSVIDTKYESFGAVCAPVNEPFGEDYRQYRDNGHDCISPDRMIDSSACKFCDYTWFVKNSSHGGQYSQLAQMCRSITEAEGQVTVWDSEYPQFNIYDGKKIVPLCKENDGVLYSTDLENENAWTVIVKFFKDYISNIKYIMNKIMNMLTSFGKRITDIKC